MPRSALAALLISVALACAAPAASARPFADTSVWNTPTPSTAPIASDSKALVAELGRQVTTSGSWINTWQYSVPVYKVAAEQPKVHVTLDVTMPELQADFDAVPIPAGAKAAAGTDQHMTVWQPATDTLWDFWKMTQAADGWHARWGGKLTGVSWSKDSWSNGFGATATGLPLLGGLIRADELKAGKIDHALAIGLPEAEAGTWSWPAQRTDGLSTAPDAIPEGTHFQLDPSLDTATLNLPPVTRMIARAAQRYGVVVRDVSGSVSFYAEDPAALASNPYPALFGGKDAAQLLAGFPWARLRVLRPPSSATAARKPARARHPRTGL